MLNSVPMLSPGGLNLCGQTAKDISSGAIYRQERLAGETTEGREPPLARCWVGSDVRAEPELRKTHGRNENRLAPPRRQAPGRPAPRRSRRRYLPRSPRVPYALIQPRSLPPPLAAVGLPVGRGVLGQGSVEVGHRLECSLSCRAWQKTSHLFAVPLDNDFLALDGQPVQDPSQIARQLCCRDGLHSSNLIHKNLMQSEFIPVPSRMYRWLIPS